MRGKGEGSIYKDKGGRWRGAVSLPDGRRRYVSGRTRREVSVKLARLQEQVRTGSLAAPGRLTVEGFLGRWLEEHVRHLEAKTAYSYEQQVRLHIAPKLGKVQLARLNRAMVQEWVNGLAASGLSPKSVKIAHGTLRAALSVAMDWDIIPANPAARITLPKAERREPPYLTLPQARALLEALAGDRLEALYITAIMLALRRGEVLALKWEDFDWEAGTVHIRRSLVVLSGKTVVTDGKTPASWAKLPLPDLAANALRRHRARQVEERLRAGAAWREMGYVFTTSIGTPISPRNLVRHWHGLLDKAGLPSPLPFHTLRHSAASLMLALGVPMRVVQQVMRHRQVGTTTDLYGHIPLEISRDAVEVLDAALRGR